MAKRKSIGSGRPSEAMIGYCRALRFDNPSSLICFSGTAPTNPDGSVYATGDPAAQTTHILEMMKETLQKLGASMKDVVRTRIFVVDILDNWEAVGKAHGEFFGEIRPATTMVGTSGLVHPDMLVEIDADAVI